MEVSKSVIQKRTLWVAIAIISILIIDQWSKFWIKTNMSLGEEFFILGMDWARIHFVENDGMAFGWKLLGGAVGKVALGIFRIVAIIFLFFVLKWLIRKSKSFGLLLSFSLILAGAIGNIIDSALYGILFSESHYHGSVATFLPESGGYGGFLFGKVVDMFYFPMIQTNWPDWIPVLGGRRFEFFGPVFNVADSAISVGVVSILIFYRDIFQGAGQSKSIFQDEAAMEIHEVPQPGLVHTGEEE